MEDKEGSRRLISEGRKINFASAISKLANGCIQCDVSGHRLSLLVNKRTLGLSTCCFYQEFCKVKNDYQIVGNFLLRIAVA